MESSILRDHALTHVWAESVQDHQYRIKPNRVSPKLGFHRIGQLMWGNTLLPKYNDPTSTTSYHLYPLGQLAPLIYTLKLDVEKWYLIDDLCTNTNVVIDIVAENGCIIPRHISYLKVTLNRYLLLAVERTPVDLGVEIKDDNYGGTHNVPFVLDEHSLSIRFYHNALTQSPEWQYGKYDEQDPDDTLEVLKHCKRKINTPADYQTFMNQANAIEAEFDTGMALYFADGFLISKPATAAISSTHEFIGKTMIMQYDRTIREKLTYKVNQLTGFRSKIDTFNDKLLLVNPHSDGKIDYCDDLDFYVVRRFPNDTYKGVMLDRILSNTVRQVTHAAWAVREDKVRDLIQFHDFIGYTDIAEIIVVIRDGGMRHEVGGHANMLSELYKLPYSGILEATANVPATLDIWKAPNLEKGDYVKVMGSKSNQISNTLVEDAYGYNGAQKAVMKTWCTVENNVINLDPGFIIPFKSKNPNASNTAIDLTIFWYNSNGLLLGESTQESITAYIDVPSSYSSATHAEVFLGKLRLGSSYTGNHPDTETVVDEDFGYYGCRHYVCDIISGVLQNNWVDVTNTSFAPVYTPADGNTPPNYTWSYNLLDQANYYPLTRFSNTIKVIKVSINNAVAVDGVLSVQLMESDRDASALRASSLPTGVVDVFVNGYSLIQGLDWSWGKGGRVVITKQLEDGITVANVVIRCYGFMNPETNAVYMPRDIGWVKNGILSTNGYYNTIDDRDVRVNVGGHLFDINEVNIEERTVTGQLQLDGYPYAIEDYIQQVEHYASKKTVEYKQTSMQTDKLVSDYLTPRLGSIQPDNEYVHGLEWPLYSLVMAHCIKMMATNVWSDAIVSTWNNDSTIIDNVAPILSKYQDNDPILVGYDEQYSYVQPYPFRIVQEVSGIQYRTLEVINRLHLSNKVDLTMYLTIRPGT